MREGENEEKKPERIPGWKEEFDKGLEEWGRRVKFVDPPSGQAKLETKRGAR